MVVALWWHSTGQQQQQNAPAQSWTILILEASDKVTIFKSWYNLLTKITSASEIGIS